MVFAGRVQPLKAPDVVLHAAAELVRDDPALAGTLTVAFVGGPSGTGRADPDSSPSRAGARASLTWSGSSRPARSAELADWYRAATVVMVPSYSESFGLVAVEAQACGTPVVAAAVGGLRTAVQDGLSGILVDGHDPASYARALRGLISSPPGLGDQPPMRSSCRGHADRRATSYVSVRGSTRCKKIRVGPFCSTLAPEWKNPMIRFLVCRALAGCRAASLQQMNSRRQPIRYGRCCWARRCPTLP